MEPCFSIGIGNPRLGGSKWGLAFELLKPWSVGFVSLPSRNDHEKPLDPSMAMDKPILFPWTETTGSQGEKVAKFLPLG